MDMEIAKIILSVCSLVVSVLTLCGFGVYMSLSTKKRFDRREQTERENERLRQEANNAALLKMIGDALDAKLSPLADDIVHIKETISLNTEGTVTLMRNDMKKMLDHYKEKGYASASDKAAWTELYNTYRKLGGNHFREYVDAWKQEVLDLPVQKTTRKRLTETKANK